MVDNKELFLHGVLEDTSEIFDWNEYRIGYFIQKNKGKSEENEDVLFFHGREDFCIFGVADGAGGHPKGKEAAHSIGDSVLRYTRKTDIDQFHFIDLIEGANTKMRENFSQAHSTLSFAAMFGSDLRSYSVGDSEVQYFNTQGNIIYNNIPQSPVGYAVEAGLMSQDEGLDHGDRYLVNNLMGDEHLRIEVASKFQLKRGYTVIVGSDGLFDNLTHDEVRAGVGSGNFEQGFNSLVEICSQRGENWRKDDDVSFIVLRKIK